MSMTWTALVEPAIRGALQITCRVTVVLLFSILLLRVLRRASSSLQHLVWSLTLTSVLVMPLCALLPGLTIELPPHLLNWVAPPLATHWTGKNNPARTAEPVGPGLDADWDHAVAPAQRSEVIQPRSVREQLGWRLPMVSWRWIWLMGVLLVTLRLVVGLASMQRIVRRGQQIGQSTHLQALMNRMGIRVPLRVVVSSEIAVPMTCGVVRSALLLPVTFASWCTERQQLVLSHELAHVRRRDCVTQLLAQLTCALYWFHPLVWYADRRLRRAAEQAADDVVIGLGVRASDYASHLLGIVRALSHPARLSSVATVSMAGTSFEERLTAILDPTKRRGTMPRLITVLAAATLLCGVALIGSMKVAAKPSGQLAVEQEESKSASHGLHHHESGEDCEAGDQAGDEAFSEAYELYSAGKYAAAVELFKKSADLHHRPATAMYNAACCLALMQQHDQAIQWLERAVEAGFAGRELYTDSDLRALRQDPRYKQLLERHREHLGSGRDDAADEHAETMAELKQLESDPSSDGEGWYDVGMALHNLGEWDRAIVAWERSFALGHSPAESRYNIACALALKGDTSAALDQLLRAVELGYGTPRYLDRDSDLASLRSDSRFAEIRKTAEILELPLVDNADRAFMAPSWAAAATRYEAYVQSHPQTGRAWFNLGYATLASEQPQRAVSAFQRAYDLSYRKATTAYNLACSHARNGDKDQAFAWLDRAREESGGKLLYRMFNDSDLDSLRDDPRFPSRVEQVKDHAEWMMHAAGDVTRRAMRKAAKAIERTEKRMSERPKSLD